MKPTFKPCIAQEGGSSRVKSPRDRGKGKSRPRDGHGQRRTCVSGQFLDHALGLLAEVEGGAGVQRLEARAHATVPVRCTEEKRECMRKSMLCAGHHACLGVFGGWVAAREQVDGEGGCFPRSGLGLEDEVLWPAQLRPGAGRGLRTRVGKRAQGGLKTYEFLNKMGNAADWILEGRMKPFSRQARSTVSGLASPAQAHASDPRAWPEARAACRFAYMARVSACFPRSSNSAAE
jgi:hypothetical protein